MGCEVMIYKSSVVSEDRSTNTTLIERTEILDTKSWELGELLAGATEAPNGSTTTANPEAVVNCLQEYLHSEECNDDDMRREVQECIGQILPVLTSDKDTIAVNVWY